MARRAELNVIRKQLLVRRIWATLDDDIIRLQIEFGHDAVVDAAAEQGGEPDGGEGEYPVNRRPAAMQVRPPHNLLYSAIRGEEMIQDNEIGDYHAKPHRPDAKRRALQRTARASPSRHERHRLRGISLSSLVVEETERAREFSLTLQTMLDTVSGTVQSFRTPRNADEVMA